MVRLDDEERHEASVLEKPGRVLLARARKFRRERGMEIHRQLRKPDRESENVLPRFEERRCQWRLPFWNADRETAECRRGSICERSDGYEPWGKCRRRRAEG